MAAGEARLIAFYQLLPESQQSALLEYAEFLIQKSDVAVSASRSSVPQPAPRPAEESVVAAIRRLRAGYPMLDQGALLHAATDLMSQHIIGGREAEQVIDELESLFTDQYEQLTKGAES